MGSSLLHRSLYLGAVTPFTHHFSHSHAATPTGQGIGEREGGGGLSSFPTCAGDAGCGHLQSLSFGEGLFFNSQTLLSGLIRLIRRGCCSEACSLSAPWLLTHAPPPTLPTPPAPFPLPPQFWPAATGVWL